MIHLNLPNGNKLINKKFSLERRKHAYSPVGPHVWILPLINFGGAGFLSLGNITFCILINDHIQVLTDFSMAVRKNQNYQRSIYIITKIKKTINLYPNAYILGYHQKKGYMLGNKFCEALIIVLSNSRISFIFSFLILVAIR